MAKYRFDRNAHTANPADKKKNKIMATYPTRQELIALS
jgi:hypothetical protein